MSIYCSNISRCSCSERTNKRINNKEFRSCSDLDLLEFYESIPDYFDIHHLAKDDFDSTLSELKSESLTWRKIVSPSIPTPTERDSICSPNQINDLVLPRQKSRRNKKGSSKYFHSKEKKHKSDGSIKRCSLCSCCNDFVTAKYTGFDEANTFDRWWSVENLHDTLPICKLKPKSNKKQLDRLSNIGNHSDKRDIPKNCSSLSNLNNLEEQHCDGVHNLESVSSINVRKSSVPKSKNKNNNFNFRNAVNINDLSSSSCKKKRSSITITPISTTIEEDNQAAHSLRADGGHSKTMKTSFSPAHLVARPNIAAKLREEVSREKLKKLQEYQFNNYTKHVDWEVRKTPAWKSLTLKKSHKELCQLRLAARRTEQALQQQVNNLNMRLMRQRVKSAPLLLEGPINARTAHDCNENRSEKSKSSRSHTNKNYNMYK